jgi:transcription elongation factor
MTILAGGLAVLALTTTAFAQSGSKAAKATSAATKPAAAAAASARGTLSAVDTAANTITLTSGKKAQTFSLASAAMIHEGSKSITITELASHKGHEAKVRYTEAGGTKTAQSVMVAAATKTSKPATN